MSYYKPFKRGVSWRSQNFGANATIYGPHSGNDDAAPIGTPVHAAGDGFIDWAGEFDDTYLDNLLWLLKMGGNILVLNCGANKPSFVYGHLHSFTVKRGDWVRKGQVIAYSGNTGTATTGAHLHTEAIPPGYALNSPMLGRVNPDIYLTEWPEDIGIGSLSYAGGTTITPLEDDVSAEDVWTHQIEDPNEPGRFFPAYEWVRRANVKAGNAEALAGAALQAITGLLQTQLPDPNSEGRTYSLAEWIVYANVKAGGAQQAASQLSPEIIAEAVAKATSSADAKAIAAHLQITVKES